MDTTLTANFRLDSLGTFSLESLGGLFRRITALSRENIRSKPFRWFLGIVITELERREAGELGELLEAGMVDYPMNCEWSIEELGKFINTLTQMSYADLDATQAKFVDETLWFAICEVVARANYAENRYMRKDEKNATPTW